MSKAGSDDLLTDDRARGFASEVSEARYTAFTPDPLEPHGMAVRNIDRGARVLDVGCGTGKFARALRDQLGCTVLGVEPHAGRAEAARAEGLEIITGYLTPEVASRGPFDVVTLIDVLEHVPDPVELLTLAANCLRPGGKVIISVPNVAHWTIRFNLLFGRFDYAPLGLMDATHLRWFTQKTIREVVQTANLRVDHQDVSRGLWLLVYIVGKPWSWLSISSRAKIIDWLCVHWPGLFGCQHFLIAIKE